MDMDMLYPKTKVTYEMNSLLTGRFKSSQMKTNNDSLDQDLLMVLMMCSLFETHKISQEDKYEANGVPPFRQLKIYFEDAFQEAGFNNFGATSIEMKTVLYGPPGRVLKSIHEEGQPKSGGNTLSSQGNTRRSVVPTAPPQ